MLPSDQPEGNSSPREQSERLPAHPGEAERLVQLERFAKFIGLPFEQHLKDLETSKRSIRSFANLRTLNTVSPTKVDRILQGIPEPPDAEKWERLWLDTTEKRRREELAAAERWEAQAPQRAAEAREQERKRKART
jgi:hypothetical protein